MTSSEVIRVAAVSYVRGFDIDRLLVDACERMARRGIRLGGLLQISTGGRGGCASTVHVVDLRTNRAFDIWEERGQCARGCRLDEGGLAAASRALDEAIADRVDLVIVNRFGRAESLGRGLLPLFSSAVAVGLPVLTAVRAPYDASWTQFHGGFGSALAPEIEAILGWSERVLPFVKAHLLESSPTG